MYYSDINEFDIKSTSSQSVCACSLLAGSYAIYHERLNEETIVSFLAPWDPARS